MFQKSGAKIEITITTTNLIRIKYPLAALIIAFLVPTLVQISIKFTAQFLRNSCLKIEPKNRCFQYGRVALAVRTQYHHLQFVLKRVAICTDTCMSLVQTVRSLLLPDFLSANPVASSRSSAEQDQSLSGNSSNNFLALQPLLCLKTLISIPSSLVKIVAFYVNQTRHKNITNITSLFVTLPAVSMLIVFSTLENSVLSSII